MEFGTREILILLGIAIILAILLDGLRRVKHARNGTLKVSRRKQAIFEDEVIDELPGELLTGEVRVKIRDEESAEQVSDHIKRSRELNTERCTSAYRNIDQIRDSNVVPFQTPPEVMEPVDESATDVSGSGAEQEDYVGDAEPVSLSEFDIDDDENEPEVEPAVSARADLASEEIQLDTQPRSEPEPLVARRDEPEPRVSEPFHLEPPEQRPRQSANRRKPFWEDAPAREPVPEPAVTSSAAQVNAESSSRPSEMEVPSASSVREDSRDLRKQPQSAQSSQAGPGEELEVVVLHVMAKKEGMISGDALLEALLANGLRYGEMHIFHRHEHADGSGPVHFSVANSIKPGTFDLAAMETFETPGVTMFMPLEGLDNPLESFNELIKVAQNLGKVLNADLKDETRSALTRQTIEHQRQQIIEYTRRAFTLTH